MNGRNSARQETYGEKETNAEEKKKKNVWPRREQKKREKRWGKSCERKERGDRLSGREVKTQSKQ